MNFVSFNMDCCERSCRAEVFTCSAADTSFLVYCRDSERLRVIRILSYHADCTGWTVSCTVSAAYLIRIHYTVVKAYDSMSDLDGRLFLSADRSDSSCRADV